jgi:hypothetical protein
MKMGVIPFTPENITITTGPRRANVIRRDTGIGEWKPMKRVRIDGVYTLGKIVLMVNGKSKLQKV